MLPSCASPSVLLGDWLAAAAAVRALLAALGRRCRRGLRRRQLRLEVIQMRLQRLSGERLSRCAQEAVTHHAQGLLVGQLAIGQVGDLAAVRIAIQLLAPTQQDRAVDDVLSHCLPSLLVATSVAIVVTDTASRESRNPADGPSLSLVSSDRSLRRWRPRSDRRSPR